MATWPNDGLGSSSGAASVCTDMGSASLGIYTHTFMSLAPQNQLTMDAMDNTLTTMVNPAMTAITNSSKAPVSRLMAISSSGASVS